MALPGRVVGMLVFALLTVIVFHFAFPKGLVVAAAAGLLWVAYVFAAVVGLTHTPSPWSSRTTPSRAWYWRRPTGAGSSSARRWHVHVHVHVHDSYTYTGLRPGLRPRLGAGGPPPGGGGGPGDRGDLPRGDALRGHGRALALPGPDAHIHEQGTESARATLPEGHSRAHPLPSLLPVLPRALRRPFSGQKQRSKNIVQPQPSCCW